MKLAAFFLVLIALRGWAVAAEPLQLLTPEVFWKLPELNRRIDISAFDSRLMSAAIFHETNRVRATQGLPAFQYLAQLDQAANSQSSIGALMEKVSHDNPLPDLATIKDRVERTGLKSRIVAENIAATTILDGPTGLRTVQVKHAEGRQVLLDPKTGTELFPRSYAAMAVAIVGQLMDSPPHRENMVSRELFFLGASATPRKNASGMDSLYSVQVFYSPPNQPVPDAPKKREGSRDSILQKNSGPSSNRVPGY